MASPFESHIESSSISGRGLGEDFFTGVGLPSLSRFEPFHKQIYGFCYPLEAALQK